MGGKASYDFDEKNRWRRWWVNQFAEKCGRARYVLRDKRLLFLCGHEGGEGDQLCEKGFSRNNLIACDADPKATAAMRRGGYGAVTGDLCTVVASWPSDIQLDAIAADFCCPLNYSAQDFLDAILIHRGLRDGLCIGVNLMRGRDKESNAVRKELSDMFCGRPRWGPLAPIRDELDRHRGWLWYLMLLSRFTQSSISSGGHVNSNDLATLLGWSCEVMQPRFETYMSGDIAMDSVVFKWSGELKAMPRPNSDALWIKRRSGRRIHNKPIRLTKAKVAAMRAITRMQCS